MNKLLLSTIGIMPFINTLNSQTIKNEKHVNKKTNVIIIYADDLGYGDISCYGATKINTPNIDKLAAQGLRFTNAHATSATSTPSRFSLLTGKYAWRQQGTNVAPGNAATIIKPNTKTIATMFQNAGYTTAAIGKWHLGLGNNGGPDWNGEIKPGPIDLGFNYNFIIPATNDRVPCVYIENRNVVGLDHKDSIKVSYKLPIGNEPTGKEHPELLKLHPSHGHNNTIINGIGRIGFMSGGKAALWNDENIAFDITSKAKNFITLNKNNPFFLYFSTIDIHAPRIANKKFAGKSGLGPRGDVILQLDWTVGEIIKTLDSLNLIDNTIIIFTSDNGPIIDDGYKDQAVELLNGHTPAGPLRGGKYSAFDGGTRIPLIVSWKNNITIGITNSMISQVDFFSSFTNFTGQKLDEKDAPDSFNMLDVLFGENERNRAYIIEHALNGTLSIIKGEWKYIEPNKGPKIDYNTNMELGNDLVDQLYDLDIDIREKNNVASQHLEIVKELSELLNQVRQSAITR